MKFFDSLVCPTCRTGLSQEAEALRCESCDAVFPVVAGVPDLRVRPDPWIGMDDDRSKALRVLEEAAGSDFEGHVRTYWRLTPGTPAQQADRFVDHVLHAADRSAEWLDRISAPEAADAPGSWLDMGCGTADLAVAAPGDAPVVGVDIAMRWLVVARRRLEEAGKPARLVCANAEALPFREGTFSRVLSLGLLEHCNRLDAVLEEAFRVLRPGGVLRFRTTNRYTLLPEPHVGLWGVGFLPRSWADGYVRARGGQGYGHHHPWSPRELARGLARSGFTSRRVEAAPVLPNEMERGSGVVKAVAPLYERVRRLPGAGRSLRWVAPLLEVGGQKAGDRREP